MNQSRLARRLPALIRNRMTELGLSEADLAELLGLGVTAVAMILAGHMVMPTAKVPALAQALDLDPIQTLRAHLHDHQPELLDVIENALARPLLSANEAALVDAYRDATGDSNVAAVIVRRGEIVEIIAMPSPKEPA